MKEHQLAVGDGRASRRGVAQQLGPGVDEVEHEQVAVERLGRDRALVAHQPDRRRVDQDPRLGQLGFDDRVVPGHRAELHVRRAPPEVLDQALGPMKVAVEHDDPLEALGDEPVDDGPSAAAGTEHDRLARHLLLADETVEGDRNPGTSVLWPISRLPSRVIVLTAPVTWASSVRRSTSGTTRSLCGIVTLAPRKPSPRISSTAAASSIGDRSQSS